MIYVDNAQIAADVLNTETGRTVSSRWCPPGGATWWCHLVGDSLDPTELHEFATGKLGLRRSYFQPGKAIGSRTVLDPSGDHYDLTEGKRRLALACGARLVTAMEMGEIIRAKRLALQGVIDLQVIVARLAEVGGTFTIVAEEGGENWSVAMEWGDFSLLNKSATCLASTALAAIEGVVREAGWSR